MHELVIRLKSGREITVICEECSITRNAVGDAVNIHFKGLKNFKPIILDLSQIELMYEVLQTGEDKDCARYAVTNDEGEKKFNCIGCEREDCQWR